MKKKSSSTARRVTGMIALATAAVMSKAQTTQSPVKDVGIQPQIELAGTGIATLDFGSGGLFGGHGVGGQSQINFADSALSFGVAQRLYHGAIGSFTLGGLALDNTNTGHGQPLFTHQAFLDFEDLKFEGYVGRTNSPAAQLVMFPTTREDDLVNYTSVLNPFSDGQNPEEHRYSNVAAVVFNQDLRRFVNIHGEHLIDSAGVGQSDTGLNSAGVNFQYEGNPALSTIERIPSYGFGFDHRAVNGNAGGASEIVYGGGVINLQPGLEKKLDLRLLGQLSFGNDTGALGTPNDTFRADQRVIAMSLRKLYSPFGKPSSQWAITAGAKQYSRISDASSFGIALSFAKSLGQGFDFVSQVGYERRSNAVAIAFDGRHDSVVLQVGLSFNFGSTFNQSVGPRRSPTNLLHTYIPN